MRTKLVSFLTAICLACTMALSASADLESDLREEAAWTEYQLGATYSRLDELYAAKNELAYQEAVINDNLYSVMVAIQLVETEIASKESQIEKTGKDLETANNAKAKQYTSMQKRIQYIYEKGGDDVWFQMLLNSENVGDLLTKAEYTQAMYESDRQALTRFANTIDQVKSLEEKYVGEKAELEVLNDEYQQTSAELEYQLALTREQSENCENEIAWAQYQANEYANLLVEITAEIARLEEERYLAELAAQQAAEEEAAAAAAAALEDAPEEFLNEDGELDEEYLQEVTEKLTVYDEDGNAISATEASEMGITVYDSDGDEVDADAVVESVSSSAGSSSAGSSIVAFAKQFVGNPYVWGGTSLTNGADCSGFVQSVYANFGISLPRTSYEQETAGVEVSYADAQPGDLICYGSHVAIYLGNGKIVHASSSTEGIIISDNAAYRTITSVRRLV